MPPPWTGKKCCSDTRALRDLRQVKREALLEDNVDYQLLQMAGVVGQHPKESQSSS